VYHSSNVPKVFLGKEMYLLTSDVYYWLVNPSKRSGAIQLHLEVFSAHPSLTWIFNFWHLGTLVLSLERQSDQMPEIKNVS